MEFEVGIDEDKTIDAINKLQSEYPFAALLLIYTIIERILKEYIIVNRYDKSNIDQCFSKVKFNNTVIQMCKFILLDNEEFINKFIKKITLGDAENIIKNCKGNYSARRNNYLHSNIYFTEQIGKDEDEKKKKNQKSYREAAKQLIEVLNKYTKWEAHFKNDKIELKILKK